MRRLSAILDHHPRQDCHNTFSWRYLLAFLLRTLPLMLLAGFLFWMFIEKTGQQGRHSRRGSLPEALPMPQALSPTDFQYSNFSVRIPYGPVSTDSPLFPIIAQATYVSPDQPTYVMAFILWDNDTASPQYLMELPGFTTGETSVLYLPERDEFLISTIRYAYFDDIEVRSIVNPSFTTAFDNNSGARPTTLVFIDAATGEYHRQMNLPSNFVPTDYSPELDLVVGVDRRESFNTKKSILAILDLETGSMEMLNVAALEEVDTHRYENPHFSGPGIITFDHAVMNRCTCTAENGWRVAIDLESKEVINGNEAAFDYRSIPELYRLSVKDSNGDYRIYQGEYWKDPDTGKLRHNSEASTSPFEDSFDSFVFGDLGPGFFDGGGSSDFYSSGDATANTKTQITPSTFYEIRRADDGALVTSTTLHLQFAGRDHILVDQGNHWEFDKIDTYIQENQVAPEYRKPPQQQVNANPFTGGEMYFE